MAKSKSKAQTKAILDELWLPRDKSLADYALSGNLTALKKAAKTLEIPKA